MEHEDSATATNRVAFGLGQAFRHLLRWLARGGHDAVYVHVRRVELPRPWEQEGPLRWRRENGRARPIGSRLPAIDR